jgi:hypothetical protein
MIDQIPVRFRPAVVRVQQLQSVEQYQAAYIFGSGARGDTTAASDLDVHVLVDRETACTSVSHPIINGVKLDLSFLSFEQLAARTAREIERAERVPMVAESTVVFDKTGDLTRLRAEATQARPKPWTAAEYQEIQFAVYHVNDKAERFLSTDPPGALLVMHTGLRELVNAHYRINSRWRVSDKRVLADLREWDPALAGLVERLVIAADVSAKFAIWTEIIEYVLAPLGGRLPIAKNNCACAACQRGLVLLSDGVEHRI